MPNLIQPPRSKSSVDAADLRDRISGEDPITLYRNTTRPQSAGPRKSTPSRAKSAALQRTTFCTSREMDFLSEEKLIMQTKHAGPDDQSDHITPQKRGSKKSTSRAAGLFLAAPDPPVADAVHGEVGERT